jgi:hypothetical protein
MEIIPREAVVNPIFIYRSIYIIYRLVSSRIRHAASSKSCLGVS